MSATLRAHHALRAVGLKGDTPDVEAPAWQPERVTNAVNEVWRCGGHVLRINPDRSSTRLQDEERLLHILPPEVLAPTPVGAGCASWGEWMVTLRVPGQELSRAWGQMAPAERRRAITEVAGALRALHHVPAPPWRAPGDSPGCPHPLPAERLLALIDRAAALPGTDSGVLDAVADRLVAAAGALDVDPTTLVHGDVHLENIMTGGCGAVTALLDFEWSRPGPPDLDLDVLLHSLADPAVHLEGGNGATLYRRDFDDVVGWMRAAYPALFAHPRLAERLWVYRLAYEVGALMTRERSDSLADPQSPHHPYQRIFRLLGDRSDIGWFLAG